LSPVVARLRGRGQITAIELDPGEARKAAARGGASLQLHVGDAFSWDGRAPTGAGYDAVVGNPPFIRYQDFAEVHRSPAFRLMQAAGLRPTRLTNAWVPFVVLATQALKPSGRLALVLPAELMQVGYAAELREFLAREYETLDIVTFRSLVFPDIQQEVVLLLGVRRTNDATAGARIRLHAMTDARDLAGLSLVANGRIPIQLDHAREKWTQYYLTKRELALVRRIREAGLARPLSTYAEVDVGVVTGLNEFFVLTDQQARDLDLLRHVLPIVARSAQLPGAVYGRAEWRRQLRAGSRGWLLQLGDTPREELSAPALRYVEAGEERGWADGYKCRIRLPNWWKVPSVAVPDGFMLRQIHEGPRVIANSAGATSTDTVHRVRTRDSVKIRDLAAVSANSLTALEAELRGRSYGGGVLELEPSEAEEILIPAPTSAPEATEVDARLRRDGLIPTTAFVDEKTLGACGIDAADQRLLRGAWERLRTRRHGRRQPPKPLS